MGKPQGKDERGGSANALTNVKHEMFCQRIALGDNQTEAAKLAGYATSCASVQGHKLMQKPPIQQRVQYLRNRTSDVAIERVALSKGWVLQNLKDNVNAARGEDDHSAVNRGLELIGKELGMFVERKILGLQDLRNASADDLYTILAVIDGELANEQQAEVVTSLEPGKPFDENLDPEGCRRNGIQVD